MQRIFLTFATATVFTVAPAATVWRPIRHRMVYKRRPVEALPSWTGFDVGAHIGAAAEPLTGGDRGPDGLSGSGGLPGGSKTAAIGGLQAGYSWQFAPSLGGGFEGDFRGPRRTTIARPIRDSLRLGSELARRDSRLGCQNAMVGQRPRPARYTGWLNNTMFDVTGGAAWADTEYTGLFQTFPPLNQANPSKTTIKSGWVAGAGAE